MLTVSKFAWILALIIGCSFVGRDAAAQSTQPVYALHAFNGSDGSRPNALTQGGDGNFYGTTAQGGVNGKGVVYKIAPDGTFTSLHTFNGVGDGAEPVGVVRDGQGNLWGIARQGGPNGNGTIFEISAGGAFRVVYAFSNYQYRYVKYPGTNGTTATVRILVNPDGAHPSALTLGPDGSLYGLAELGGANGDGAAFKITPVGTFSVLYTFSLFTLTPGAAVPSAQISDFRSDDGGNPVNAPLVVGADNALYGLTSEGGPEGFGTIFRLTTGGMLTRIGGKGNGFNSTTTSAGANGVTQISIHFDVFPVSMRLGPDGNFYIADGSHPTFNQIPIGGSAFFDGGNVFRLTPGGVITPLFTFPTVALPLVPNAPLPDAYDPSGLILASDGTIYGTARQGGPNSAGTIFRLAADAGSPTGFTPLTLYIPVVDGGMPENLLLASDGYLYGTGQLGGKNGDGSVWEVAPMPVPFLMHSFAGPEGRWPISLLQGKDGNLYGATRATTDDNISGTIFTITADSTLVNDTFRVLHNLTRFDPSGLNSGMIQASDGLIYGTSVSGVRAGGIFNVTAGGQLTSLYNFPGRSSIYGGTLFGGVIEGPPGTFYGTTGAGGVVNGMDGSGIVYSFKPGDALPTILHTFVVGNHGPGQPDDGSVPGGNLLLASDGRLYGTTTSGGKFANSSLGTLYSLNPNAAPPNYDFLLVHHFDGDTESGNPSGALVEGKDGALYGTLGVSYYPPAVFKVNKDGMGLQILHYFTFSEGVGPVTPLLLGADGNLYGMIGGDGRGAIYRITPDGDFRLLYKFHGLDGEDHYNGNSLAALVQGADGNLYGVAGSGGLFGYKYNPPYIDGFGTIFRLAIARPKAIIPDAATDVTGQFTATITGHSIVGGVHTYSMKLTNIGGALVGPLALALDNLPAGTNLLNAVGNTNHALPAGSPFILVTGGGVTAGAKFTVKLKTNKPLTPVHTKRILSGPSPF